MIDGGTGVAKWLGGLSRRRAAAYMVASVTMCAVSSLYPVDDNSPRAHIPFKIAVSSSISVSCCMFGISSMPLFTGFGR